MPDRSGKDLNIYRKNFMNHSIEWAAGLFEGEGCMTKHPHRRSTFMMEVWMKDKDVIEKFFNTVGVGSLSSRKPQKEHWSPMYGWRLYRGEDIRQLLGKMLPYFGNRRAYTALNILDDLELA